MIHRKIEDVETLDVGKVYGMPEGTMLVKWIFSKEVGDEKYGHRFAVRKYTHKPVDPKLVPYHRHKYIQSIIIITGRVACETPEGVIEAGPGDTVIFYENEPHKITPVGDETVELYCVIDCPGGGEDCIAQLPQNVKTD